MQVSGTNQRVCILATTANMPGFRPGKVPMSVIKTRFGDQVRGDAIKSALDEGTKQAIESNNIRLASQPQVDIKTYEEGKNLEASLSRTRNVHPSSTNCPEAAWIYRMSTCIGLCQMGDLSV